MNKGLKNTALFLFIFLMLMSFPGAVQADVPAAPTGLQAVSVTDGSRVMLTWAATGAGNSFNIYRSLDNISFVKVNRTPVTGTSYEDSGLTPATTYYYYLTAVNSQMEESAPSEHVAVTTLAVDNTPPTTPTGLTGSAVSYQQVTVSWHSSTDVSGIKHYELWYRQGNTGSFSKIIVTGTSYTHTGLQPGATYQYYVVAVDNYNNASSAGTTITLQTLPDNVKPAAPASISATADSSVQISLTWSAGTDNVGVAGYNIYRKAGSSGFTKINSSVVNATNYYDTGLTPGATYTYQVATVDTAGNESAGRAEVSRTTLPDNQAPSVPGSVSAQVLSATQIKLSWNASTDNVRVAEYIIYRSTDNRTFARVGSSTITYYTNTGLSPNTTYYYKISAKDSTGNESAQSAAVSAKTTVDTQKPVSPRIWANAVSTTKVKVTWSGASDNVGITGYDLYRAVGSGSYVKVAAPSSSPYYDTDVSSGKTYKYYLRARDAAGNYSDNSNIVTVTTNGDTTDPSEPKSLSYTLPRETEVRLSWEAATDNRGIAGYNIYRAEDSGDYYCIASTASLSYYDRSVAAGKTYKYYVTAYDSAGNESDASNYVNVYTSLVSEEVEKTIDKGDSGYLEISSLARLDIPADTLARDTTFRMQTRNFGSYTNTGYHTIGQPVDITAKAGSSNVTAFDRDLTITFYYTSDQLGDMDPDTLNIYYWDTANRVWAPLESTVYSSSKKVTARTDHLTVFALLADDSEPEIPTLNNIATAVRRNVTLTGKAEKYAAVEVRLNGETFKTQAGGTGAFSLDVYLKVGANTVELRAKDAAGNTSDWSDEYKINCNPTLVLNDIAGHWAERNIQKVLDLGITSGYSDGTFRPDRTITRAEFCKFVIAAMGLSPVQNPELTFSDRRNIPDWARGYIARAVNEGIISGYDDNTFRADREISRQEMASMLIRALKLQAEARARQNYSLDFHDAGQIQSWAKGAVVLAVEKGLISGYADNSFGPARKATRAEAITMIVKFMDIRKSR